MIRLTYDQTKALINQLKDAAIIMPLRGDAREALGTLEEQFAHPHHDSDMIERIATILQAPRAKSILGGEYLRMLRKALLSPREIAGIEAVKALHCVRCEVPIADGELCSFTDSESIFCWHCNQPTSIPCRGCNTSITLPTGVGRVVQKAFKECTQCAAQRQPIPEPPITAREAERRIEAIFNEAETIAYAPPRVVPEWIVTTTTTFDENPL